MRLGLLLVVVGSLLLAGCVDEPVGDTDDAPEPTLDSDAVFGLRIFAVELHGAIAPGEEKTWRVEVRNGGAPGENSVDYRDGCGNPWQAEVQDADGRPAAWQEPMAQCMGFQEKELRGGEKHAFAWTWDARRWDEGAKRMQDAPEGRYTLLLTFEGEHDGTHPTDVTARTTFEVR